MSTTTQKRREEVEDFLEAVARSVCLDQRLGDECKCFSCLAKALIDNAEEVAS